jgi:hypothetical protein
MQQHSQAAFAGAAAASKGLTHITTSDIQLASPQEHTHEV